GGLIGLRLLAEYPRHFAKVVAANTFLPTGDQPLGPAFEQWQVMARSMKPFPVGNILQVASLTSLSAQEIAAYDAPFPDESYKAGVRIFPELVPTSHDDPAAPANRQAWAVLRQLDTPFLTLFSDSDPITKGAEKYLQQYIPGAKGQAHQILSGGGHFLQEDVAEELVTGLLAFFAE
ncbi:MAG: alpha/beta fold hydrolase, partial [Bacteroidota bacterium]